MAAGKFEADDKHKKVLELAVCVYEAAEVCMWTRDPKLMQFCGDLVEAIDIWAVKWDLKAQFGRGGNWKKSMARAEAIIEEVRREGGEEYFEFFELLCKAFFELKKEDDDGGMTWKVKEGAMQKMTDVNVDFGSPEARGVAEVMPISDGTPLELEAKVDSYFLGLATESDPIKVDEIEGAISGFVAGQIPSVDIAGVWGDPVTGEENPGGRTAIVDAVGEELADRYEMELFNRWMARSFRREVAGVPEGLPDQSIVLRFLGNADDMEEMWNLAHLEQVFDTLYFRNRKGGTDKHIPPIFFLCQGTRCHPAIRGRMWLELGNISLHFIGAPLSRYLMKRAVELTSAALDCPDRWRRAALRGLAHASLADLLPIHGGRLWDIIHASKTPIDHETAIDSLLTLADLRPGTPEARWAALSSVIVTRITNCGFIVPQLHRAGVHLRKTSLFRPAIITFDFSFSSPPRPSDVDGDEIRDVLARSMFNKASCLESLGAKSKALFWFEQAAIIFTILGNSESAATAKRRIAKITK